MAIGNRLPVAPSRKHRQGSRFLGRRLVQASAGRFWWSRLQPVGFCTCATNPHGLKPAPQNRSRPVIRQIF
jgi:hypothetical protein